MSDHELDQDLPNFMDVREAGADYKKHEEHTQQAGAFPLPIDATNYKKFPRVDDNAVYKKTLKDYRGEIQADSKVELPDYSGPFKFDLRFTDFSNDALHKLLWASYEYYALLMEAWTAEIALRKGDDLMREIQAAAWTNGVIPKIPDMVKEWMGFEVDELPDVNAGVVTFNPFKPDSRYSACDKERLTKMLLGSHEFLLKVIEAFATQVIIRYGLDEMFSIQWALWSDKVLPAVRGIKVKWMNVDGGDSTPVEAFMKDIQIDMTSAPGKAFEMTFEMPDRNTGLIEFNRCIAVDQWEALGRPDILEKNCHSVCPASMIETSKMYDPNMKVDILAIPPRKSKDNVCCKWRLSMRDESDPEYVPVEITGTRSRSDAG